MGDGPLRITMRQRNRSIVLSVTDWGTNNTATPIWVNLHTFRSRDLYQNGETFLRNIDLINAITGEGKIMIALTEMGPYKALQNGFDHVVVRILNAMGLPIPVHMAKLVKAGTDFLTAVEA